MFKDGKYYGWIYKITNKVNNKIYIGKTIQTISRRWSQHITNSKLEQSHSIVDQAISKYGKDNFEISNIEELCSKNKKELNELLCQKEKYYIKKYKSHVSQNNYNITWGGNNLSEKCFVPVDCYDKDGRFIKEYKSIIEATYDLGLTEQSYANISGCCKGRKISAYGYIWRLHGHPFDEYQVHPQHLSLIPIDVYDLNGNLEKEYGDIYDISIAKEEKVRTYIYRVCNGDRPRYKDKVYRYHGESFDKYSLPKATERYLSYNCYDKNYQFVRNFKNSTEAAEFLVSQKGGSMINARTCILECIRNKKQFYYNFYWFKANDPNQPDKSRIVM